MARDAIRAYARTLRTARGLSQKEVAEAAGVTRLAWGNYELGHSEMVGSDVLITAWRFLGGSFRDLKDLSADSADAAYGVSLAQRRAEALAAGELDAYGETYSTAELEALLGEIDQMVAGQSGLRALLRDAINRLRRGDG